MKLSEKLKSNNYNYSEKIEIACKELPINYLQQWSIDCAESVLPIFEKYNPNDTRVRDCINTTKLVLNGKLDKDAADAAANSAYAAANSAYAAARAAAYAAADAAYAARAADAAAYAARAAADAGYAATNEKEQEKLNLNFLLKYVEIYESPLYQAMMENF